MKTFIIHFLDFSIKELIILNGVPNIIEIQYE